MIEWDGVTRKQHGERLDIAAVWGAVGSDVWLAGEQLDVGGQSRGLLRRWNGTRLVEVSIPPLPSIPVKALRGVWGTSSSNVYAVGDGEAIYRFDGNAWTTVESRAHVSFEQFSAVHGSSPTNVWVARSGGVRRFTGSTWLDESLGFFVSDVWTTGPNDGWAVGWSSGPRIARKVGGSWSTFPMSPFATGSMVAVWASGPNDVWIGGAGLFRWNGSMLLQVLPSTTTVRDIAGRGPSDVVIITDTGARRWNGVSWSDVDVGSQFAPEAVWLGNPGEAWYVGRNVARRQSN